MKNEIYGAMEFYPFTAEQLPKEEGAEVLDLGCGTGLELEWYFKINPSARVTGIDLCQKMLDALEEKLGKGKVHTVNASYLEYPLGVAVYDGAVSVESLHHFTFEEKTKLYKRLHASLKDGAYFILTDYFAKDDEEEQELRAKYGDLIKAEGEDGVSYHFDTPLTPEHEIEALTSAGFSSVKILRSFSATYTIKAMK
jgi:tRNA (cmo5U34)-methyltransferase